MLLTCINLLADVILDYRSSVTDNIFLLHQIMVYFEVVSCLLPSPVQSPGRVTSQLEQVLAPVTAVQLHQCCSNKPACPPTKSRYPSSQAVTGQRVGHPETIGVVYLHILHNAHQTILQHTITTNKSHALCNTLLLQCKSYPYKVIIYI